MVGPCVSHPLRRVPVGWRRCRARARPEHRERKTVDEILTIDCATCTARHTDACDDCVVTFLCAREPEDAVVVDLDELRALRLLHEAGLAPQLRHRTGS